MNTAFSKEKMKPKSIITNKYPKSKANVILRLKEEKSIYAAARRDSKAFHHQRLSKHPSKKQNANNSNALTHTTTIIKIRQRFDKERRKIRKRLNDLNSNNIVKSTFSIDSFIQYIIKNGQKLNNYVCNSDDSINKDTPVSGDKCLDFGSDNGSDCIDRQPRSRDSNSSSIYNRPTSTDSTPGSKDNEFSTINNQLGSRYEPDDKENTSGCRDSRSVSRENLNGKDNNDVSRDNTPGSRDNTPGSRDKESNNTDETIHSDETDNSVNILSNRDKNNSDTTDNSDKPDNSDNPESRDNKASNNDRTDNSEDKPDKKEKKFNNSDNKPDNSVNKLSNRDKKSGCSAEKADRKVDKSGDTVDKASSGRKVAKAADVDKRSGSTDKSGRKVDKLGNSIGRQGRSADKSERKVDKSGDNIDKRRGSVDKRGCSTEKSGRKTDKSVDKCGRKNKKPDKSGDRSLLNAKNWSIEKTGRNGNRKSRSLDRNNKDRNDRSTTRPRCRSATRRRCRSATSRRCRSATRRRCRSATRPRYRSVTNSTSGSATRSGFQSADRCDRKNGIARIVNRTDRRIKKSNRNVNRSNRSANRTDRSANRTDRSANRTDRSANRTDRSANRTDRSHNRADRSANRSDRSANRSDRSANRSDRSANRTDCSANKTDRSTNRADRTANTTNRSANRSDHSANRTDRSAKRSDRGAKKTGRGAAKSVERSDRIADRTDCSINGVYRTGRSVKRSDDNNVRTSRSADRPSSSGASSKNDGSVPRSKSVCRCGVTVSNEVKDKNVKTKVQWVRPRGDAPAVQRKLEYLDILDDLTTKDLLPLRSEYPRRDFLVDEKLGLEQNRDIHETYLWKMMYGKEKNDKIWSHLLQPKIECVDKSCHFCEHRERDKWKSVDDNLGMPRVSRSVRSRSALFEITDKASLRQYKNKSKRKVIEKLAPYLFDPKEERNNQTLIVMPVRVFYENQPLTNVSKDINTTPPVTTPKNNRRMAVPKLQLTPMKEAKTASKAKWQPATAKAKRIIASLQTQGGMPKIVKMNSARSESEKNDSPRLENRSATPRHLKYYTPTYDPREPQQLTLQQAAYQKSIMRNLKRLMTIQERERHDQLRNSKDARSLSPPRIAPLHSNRSSNSTGQNQKNPHQQTQEQKKNESNLNSNKRPNNESRISTDSKSLDKNEFDKQITENKSDFERKMLSYKYGKSIGEQLVSFLNHQPPSPDLLIPPAPPNPMHVPRNVGPNFPKNNVNPIRADNGGFVRGDGNRNGRFPNSRGTAMRHNQMLLHLRGLKQKNNQIQSNIQKAINVIENKMVDILSGPGDSTNVEAFDIMEKEITNVLKMMKFNATGSARGGFRKPDMYGDSFETISNELFSKLERILDSDRSKESGAEDQASPKPDNGEAKEEIPMSVSLDKLQLPQDDNANSPRRSLKHKLTTPPRVKSSEIDTCKLAQDELAMGENANIDEDGISDHIFDYREDVDKNHGDHSEGQVKSDDKSEANIIWDTTEQLERLDRILKEDPTAEGIVTNNFEEALREQENDRLLQNLEGMAQLDHIIESPKIEERDSQDQLDFLKTRINALLVSSRREEMSSPHRDVIPNSAEGEITASPFGGKMSEGSVSANIRMSPRRDEMHISMIPCRDEGRMFDQPSSSDLDVFITPPRTEIKLATFDGFMETLPEYQNPIMPDSDESDSDLSDQVNKIIRRVEDIYAQLEDFQTGDEVVPVFSDKQHMPKIPSQEFLTPFMQAVRDKKKAKQGLDNSYSDPLEVTPSYYNILHFLDTLNDIETDKAQEVHTARLINYAYAYNVPTVFHQASIEFPIHYMAEKSSCMKKIDDLKGKNKKVSFFVLDNELSKETQATVCSSSENKASIQEFDTTENKSILEEKGNCTEIKINCQINEYVNKEVQNNSLDVTESSIDTSERTDVSRESFASATSIIPNPKIKVHYSADEFIPQIIYKNNQLSGNYGSRSIMQVKNQSKKKAKPSVVIFREISNIADLLKRPKNLEEFNDAPNMKQLLPTNGDMLENFKEDNVVFLKSFYAFIYILIFTALNMDYKCY